VVEPGVRTQAMLHLFEASVAHRAATCTAQHRAHSRFVAKEHRADLLQRSTGLTADLLQRRGERGEWVHEVGRGCGVVYARAVKPFVGGTKSCMKKDRPSCLHVFF